MQKVLKGEAPSKSTIKAAAKIARKDPKAAKALLSGERKAKPRKKKEEAMPANPDATRIGIGGESLTTTEYCELMIKRLTEPGDLCFTDRLTNEAVEIVRHGSLDQLCKITQDGWRRQDHCGTIPQCLNLAYSMPASPGVSNSQGDDYGTAIRRYRMCRW